MSGKSKSLDVEILIPDEIIQGDESLKKHYDPKTKTLSYDKNGVVPKEVAIKIKKILGESQTKEIVALNPLIEAVISLQELRTVKYDPENSKESSQEFKDGKKMVGSFNSTLRDTKKSLKAPHIEYNRSVDDIYNVFKEISDNTKSDMEENFKPYLDEQARIKKAKDDKKKQEELDRIAALSKENEENVEKLNNQRKQTETLEINAAINKIVIDATDKTESLNVEALKGVLIDYANMTFAQKVQVSDLFSEEETEDFIRAFTDKKSKAVGIITKEIESLNEKERAKEVEQENAVLKASRPESIMVDDDPFEGMNTPGPVGESSDESEPSNDAEKLQALCDDATELNNFVRDFVSSARELSFENEQIQNIVNRLVDQSMPQVIQYTSKIEEWLHGKNESYINSLNKSE